MAGLLLDSNVLIALSMDGHVHHEAAIRWFAHQEDRFATCPITEGSLVHEVLRGGDSVEVAIDLLRQISDLDRHDFWPDQWSYLDVHMSGVLGHKQVTDAYLAEVARRHDGQLATFDRGLASLHSDVAELVPTP